MSTPGDLLGALSRRLGNGGIAGGNPHLPGPHDRGADPANPARARARCDHRAPARGPERRLHGLLPARLRRGGGDAGRSSRRPLRRRARGAAPRASTSPHRRSRRSASRCSHSRRREGPRRSGNPPWASRRPHSPPRSASSPASRSRLRSRNLRRSRPTPYGAPPPPPPAAAPFAPALHAHAAAPPAAQSESAYVTAHLAALARAERPRAYEREPTVRRRTVPPPDPDWSAAPRPAPELPGAVQWEPPRVPAERRTVAPGSQARARAGVARRLQRSGISEELAQELIAAAGAHALALAPRAGLVQAVRATIAQRIPVAPPLSAKGAAVVLVGAGGSGKTTCCAALLGAYRASSSLPASCATITRSEESSELQVILSPHIMTPTAARTPPRARCGRCAAAAKRVSP